MNVVLSNKVKDYLAKKRQHSLLVSTYHCHGWSGTPEQVVRFVDSAEVQKLKDDGVPCFPTETGNVFITQFWVPEDPNATIEFDLNNFFGAKTIVAKGLRRPELFF